MEPAVVEPATLAELDGLRSILLGEIETCAGHTKHDRACNCERPVDSVLHRIYAEGYRIGRVPGG